MKKKYKLIKIYPNNTELGVEVVYSEMYNNYFPVGGSYNDQRTKNEVEGYPEFWEEVSEEEREYEILSFSDGSNIYYKMSSGLFTINTAHTYSKEYLLEKCQYYIHSVKRFSDGEIFTVGDTLDFNNCGTGKLLEIQFEVASVDKGNGTLCFVNDNSRLGRWWSIDKLNKVKQSLFTTEDGVEIFDGDIYYTLYLDSYKILQNTASELFKVINCLKFSTKEAAEEYIKMNRPEFSRRQVIEMLDKLKNK